MKFQYVLQIGVLLLTSCSALCQLHSDRQSAGSIEGKVENEAGIPVTGAKVTIDQEGAAMLGRSPTAISDAYGRFVLANVPAGDVFVLASKANDFYPDTRAAVFSDGMNSLTKVVVKQAETTKGVVVRLQRGAKLTGVVVDGYTDKPVLSARIRLIREDKPGAYFSSSPTITGDFSFAIVAQRAYRIEVMAPGYQNWNADGRNIVAEPGDVEEVRIVLTRAKKQAEN